MRGTSLGHATSKSGAREEQAPGELPPGTSVWKSHQAPPGTPALVGEIDIRRESGHRETEKSNHLSKIK